MSNKNSIITTLNLVSITIISGMVLFNSSTFAATDVIDHIGIEVSASCTINGTGMNSHTASIPNGTSNSSIGETTIKAFCNDNAGFSIYAVGFTNNEYGSNVLTDSNLGSTYDILTGTSTSGANSNWAMKLTTSTTATYPVTLQNNFNDFHNVPTEYTLVAKRESGTDNGSSATGSTITTTYQAYISSNQPSGLYKGQVKYVLVHPAAAIAGKLNVTYDANGLLFTNNKPTNLVTYNALYNVKTSRSSYNADGDYDGYTTPGGNDVVTIPGADNLHIKVTYGVPQGTGGPPSNLYIWAGNYPSYTNANNTTSLTACGTTNATDGSFYSSGSNGSQVTMECDIPGDSVTFYDYGQYNVSTGYYAEVAESGVEPYTKTTISGTYTAPEYNADNDVFLGWSTNPEAETAEYANEADFRNNAPYINTNENITLYAITKKTFNGKFANAGKTKYNGYYKIQDMDTSICAALSTNENGSLIDERDDEVYMVAKLADNNCWMLENLRLDPTDSTTAARMNANNTNAPADAITNYLNGGNPENNEYWSTSSVENVTSFGGDDTLKNPRVNTGGQNSNGQTYTKDTYIPTIGGGTGRVGVYYNFCAASMGTACTNSSVVSMTYDVCPINWKIPSKSEFEYMYRQYGSESPSDGIYIGQRLRIPKTDYYWDNYQPNQASTSSVLWTSAASSSGDAYYPSFSTQYMYVYSWYKRTGMPVRCMLSGN